MTITDGDDSLACFFSVELDARWVTRVVSVRSVALGGVRELELRSDGDGRWLRDGVHSPDLEGCVEADVASTPLTNTFPIRRLAELSVGESTTTPVAWVDVPALTVSRVDQTYRRLGAVTGAGTTTEEWEYSDPLHGAFRLSVDTDGLVVDYEGLFTRVVTLVRPSS